MHRDLKLTRIAPAGMALVLMALLLVSCGGSSGSATTGTTAQASASGTTATQPSASGTTATQPPASSAPSATATAPTPPSPNSLRSRVKALRECLSRNGVNLPKPGSGRIGLPPGVSKAQYEAALHKCAPTVKAPTAPGASSSARSGRFRKALEAFAACMRSHGVNLPPPNNSGTGPLFNTKGLNTQTPAFHAATAACRSTLRSALPVQPGSR